MANLSYIQVAKLLDLLKSADPQREMYARVIDGGLALGVDALRPTRWIDFSTETLRDFSTETLRQFSVSSLDRPPNDHSFERTKFSRRSGNYWFEIKGERKECSSLKELLGEYLKATERKYPGTLQKLSHIRARSRHIVARDPNQLFEKDWLVKRYAQPLTDGWYYGTNNSLRETEGWMRRAAECAGVTWGKDVRTNLGELSIQRLA